MWILHVHLFCTFFTQSPHWRRDKGIQSSCSRFATSTTCQASLWIANLGHQDRIPSSLPQSGLRFYQSITVNKLQERHLDEHYIFAKFSKTVIYKCQFLLYISVSSVTTQHLNFPSLLVVTTIGGADILTFWGRNRRLWTVDVCGDSTMVFSRYL